MEIVRLKIKDLKPYANNAKVHTQEQVDQIINSIKQFGMNDPVGIWGKENIIVEGHGRMLALQKMGEQEVDCIRLDHLTDEERKAYTLAHNKLTMNTDFDFDILEEELNAISGINMSDFGFLAEEAEDLQVEIIEDDYEDNIQEEPKSKRGQIYQLGDHRLMCGDSTNAQDVENLMGGGTSGPIIDGPSLQRSVGASYETKRSKTVTQKNRRSSH